MSDDGTRGLTVIAFIGSVFSPYYAWSRRRSPFGRVDPLEHVAVNVALYGADGRRWAMTERGAGSVDRDPHSLRIGPSRLQWDGSALTLTLDEITSPWPSRVRGTVRLLPAALHATSYRLDAAGVHRWQPIAPCARVEVNLSHPHARWQGSGYFDTNRGSAPLERDVRGWHWSRARLPNDRTAVFYDVARRDGSELGLALSFDPASGSVRDIAAPPVCGLARSRWRLERTTRSDAGHPASVLQSLEDGPFYSRSVVRSHAAGQAAVSVHETLDLDRFASPWVQALLPFRMPRRA